MQEQRVFPKIAVKQLQKSRSMLNLVKSRKSLIEEIEDQGQEINQSLIELEEKMEFASKEQSSQFESFKSKTYSRQVMSNTTDDFVINQRDNEQPQVGDLKILRQYKLSKNQKNQSSSEKQLIPCYQQNNSLLTPNYKYQVRFQDKKVNQKENLQGIGQSDTIKQRKYQERSYLDTQGEILEQKQHSSFVIKNFQTLQKQIKMLRNSKQKGQNILVSNESNQMEDSLDNLSSIELAGNQKSNSSFSQSYIKKNSFSSSDIVSDKSSSTSWINQTLNFSSYKISSSQQNQEEQASFSRCKVKDKWSTEQIECIFLCIMVLISSYFYLIVKG